MHLESDSSVDKIHRITLQDAETWVASDPDWEEGARQGDRLVELTQHLSAGISRFLARSIDTNTTDMVASRLRNDIDQDVRFAAFARWLVE